MVVVVVWVVGNMRGSRGGGQRGQQVCMCPRWVALKEETACILLLNRTTLLQPDTRCACVSLTLNGTWSPFLKVFCHQRHDGRNHMLVLAVNNGKHKVSYRHMSNFFFKYCTHILHYSFCQVRKLDRNLSQSDWIWSNTDSTIFVSKVERI